MTRKKIAVMRSTAALSCLVHPDTVVDVGELPRQESLAKDCSECAAGLVLRARPVLHGEGTFPFAHLLRSGLKFSRWCTERTPSHSHTSCVSRVL